MHNTRETTLITDTARWMAYGHGHQIPRNLRLSYDPTDPCFIQARFLPSGDDPETVLWEIPRVLLAQGAESRAGDEGGEVIVAVCADQPGLVDIALRDVDTGAWGRFLARRADLTAFLARTYEVAPAAAERLDVDAVLEALLPRQH